MLEKQAIYHTSALQQTNPKKLVPLERRDKKKSATIKAVEQALIQAVKFWLTPEGNKGKYFLTQVLKSSLFPQIGDVKATALVNQLNAPINGPESAWIAFAKRVPNRNTGHVGYFLEAWENSLQQSKNEGHSELTCTATATHLRTFLQQSRQWDQLCEAKPDGQPIKQPGDESVILAPRNRRIKPIFSRPWRPWVRSRFKNSFNTAKRKMSPAASRKQPTSKASFSPLFI
jgi:hypothetical protein